MNIFLPAISLSLSDTYMFIVHDGLDHYLSSIYVYVLSCCHFLVVRVIGDVNRTLKNRRHRRRYQRRVQQCERSPKFVWRALALLNSPQNSKQESS